jgi:hypothetical protein
MVLRLSCALAVMASVAWAQESQAPDLGRILAEFSVSAAVKVELEGYRPSQDFVLDDPSAAARTFAVLGEETAKRAEADFLGGVRVYGSHPERTPSELSVTLFVCRSEASAQVWVANMRAKSDASDEAMRRGEEGAPELVSSRHEEAKPPGTSSGFKFTKSLRVQGQPLEAAGLAFSVGTCAVEVALVGEGDRNAVMRVAKAAYDALVTLGLAPRSPR